MTKLNGSEGVTIKHVISKVIDLLKTPSINWTTFRSTFHMFSYFVKKKNKNKKTFSLNLKNSAWICVCKLIFSLFFYNLDFLVKWTRFLFLLRSAVTLTYSSSQLFLINSVLKADFGGKYPHSIWVSCNLWQVGSFIDVTCFVFFLKLHVLVIYTEFWVTFPLRFF